MKKTALLIALVASLASCNHSLKLYVGTYGGHYYVTSLDEKAAWLKIKDSVEAKDPSYLCLGNASIYAVSETDGNDGVYTFQNGFAKSYNTNVGASPCYITLLGENSRYVATADYNGGSISVFSTDNGVIDERVQNIVFEPHSHIHQLKFIPGTNYLLASDLGDDCIHIMKVDDTDSPVSHVADVRDGFPCGCGPRHMEFNESAHMLYVICELSDELIVFHYELDGEVPSFQPVQIFKANEADAHGSADIHLSPDGRFLYTSHRLKNDGVAAFAVAQDGTLAKAGYFNTGRHPRNFLITPDGLYMLVACRDDAEVQVYGIDSETGALSYHSATGFGPDKPVCVILAE